MTGPGAQVRRDGDALEFVGVLDRVGAAALWRRVQPLLGSDVARIDLQAVDAIDSAGLALLAQVAAQAGDISVSGSPTGLSELRAAYRLDDDLNYAG